MQFNLQYGRSGRLKASSHIKVNGNYALLADDQDAAHYVLCCSRHECIVGTAVISHRSAYASNLVVSLSVILTMPVCDELRTSKIRCMQFAKWFYQLRQMVLIAISHFEDTSCDRLFLLGSFNRYVTKVRTSYRDCYHVNENFHAVIPSCISVGISGSCVTCG